MRDFIDSLRVRRTVNKPSLELNHLGEATGIGAEVRQGSDGRDSMDKALRLVCDHLDALVTVCDAVLHDCASELFADDRNEVHGCLVGPAVVRDDETESEVEEETSVEDCARLQTENRQMFDQIVEMIRQVENADIRHSSSEMAHIQTQRTEQTGSTPNEYSRVDTDHISESTEANLSHESSYTTCDRYSSGSMSPNVQVQRGFEEMSTDFTSTANGAQFYSDGNAADNELGKRNINKCSQIHAKVSEDAAVFDAEVQTFRSAMELLHKEKRLLQLQERSNVTLHHELMKLSDENGRLQDIISDLRTSLDRKNNEVLCLTEKADHVSQLLDEQVEEFRCVFRAVSRENDEEVSRLTAENSELKSALESLNTKDDSSDREESENKPSMDGTAPGDAYEAIIHENVVCAIPEKMQTKGFLDNRSVGVGPETQDEVSSQQSSVVSCGASIELEELASPQGSSLVLDCHKPDLVVPVYCIDDLWSEIDALKKMVPGRGFHLAKNVEEDGRLRTYKDWKDSGAVTHPESDDTVAVDERAAGQESTQLPFETDDPFCCHQSRNLSSSTPMMSPHGTSLHNGNDLHGNHKHMMMEGKLTRKPSLMSTRKNEVETSRVNSRSTSSIIGDKLQNSRLPDMKISSPMQTSCLPRSFSDSCLLPKSYTSDGTHLTQNTPALLQATKRVDECSESDTGIRRAVCGGFDDVKIFTQVPDSGEEKQTKSEQTVPVKWLQNERDSDPSISFGARSCVQESATERNSVSLLSAESFPCISPLPSSRPNERPSLSDLVLQMRHQNARLACYLSVVKSLHRQWDCDQTTDHNDHQLQKHISELSEFTDPQQHGDDAATTSVTLPPTTYPPFPALSVVCLERPLVVDLTTRATALDSNTVTSHRNKLLVGHAITVRVYLVT